MDTLTVALIFAVYLRIGYAIPNFEDNKMGFVLTCFFMFFFGLLLMFMFWSLVGYILAAIFTSTLGGMIFAMWKKGAFKKKEHIISDSI